MQLKTKKPGIEQPTIRNTDRIRVHFPHLINKAPRRHRSKKQAPQELAFLSWSFLCTSYPRIPPASPLSCLACTVLSVSLLLLLCSSWKFQFWLATILYESPRVPMLRTPGPWTPAKHHPHTKCISFQNRCLCKVDFPCLHSMSSPLSNHMPCPCFTHSPILGHNQNSVVASLLVVLAIWSTWYQPAATAFKIPISSRTPVEHYCGGPKHVQIHWLEERSTQWSYHPSSCLHFAIALTSPLNTQSFLPLK